MAGFEDLLVFPSHMEKEFTPEEKVSQMKRGGGA